MRKSIFASLSLLLLLFSNLIFAQQYKPFKMDIGVGYIYQIDKELFDETMSNFSTYLEPKYNLRDDLSVGMSIYSTVFVAESERKLFEIGMILSMALVGEYYFTDRNVRPYLGMGIGWYQYFELNGASLINQEENIVKPSIGFRPKVGVLIHRLNLSLIYHLTASKVIPNYAGLGVGFYFGGGKIKPDAKRKRKRG